MKYAFALMLLLLFLQSRPAYAVRFERTPAAPCTLLVFDDEQLVGCDQVEANTPNDALMASAAEQAIDLMRAWTKRSTRRLFPSPEIRPDSGQPNDGRDEVRAFLVREMQRTVSIDSMAVSLAPDSISYAGSAVDVRCWVARTVRVPSGGTIREVLRHSLRANWRHEESGWVLSDVHQVGSESNSLDDVGVAALEFPPHERERQRRPRSKRDVPGTRVYGSRYGEETVDLTQLPRNLRAGAIIEPLLAGCTTGKEQTFVYYEDEPIPDRKTNAVYPWDGTGNAKVILQVRLTESGAPCSIRVEKGEAPFAVEAVKAVAQWEWVPAKANGKPVAVSVVVPVDFHR